VTPSHVADRLPGWLSRLRCQPAWQDQPLPVIWNSSGYETVDSLLPLQGLVQIYLPDLKFHDAGLSQDLAGAADYFAVASRAVKEMHRQQPEPVWGADGLLLRGLVVRHLVLPGHWRDSCQLIDFLADAVPLTTPLSLMSQYTPQEAQAPHRRELPSARHEIAAKWQRQDIHPEMDRRLTTYEYRKVVDYAQSRGFGHILTQERSSASAAYTPDFSERFRPGRT
jgi:putative pyruvate formate lyase activating enzyme